MMILLELLVVLVVLAIIGCAAYYIITKFGLPQPVMMITGCVLLLILLFYAVAVFDHGGPLIVDRPVAVVPAVR